MLSLKKAKAKSILIYAIERLLRLGAEYRVHTHVWETKQRDWRELEVELSVDYPVKGIGIIATPADIKLPHHRFLHDEEDVESGQLSPLLGDMPIDAAMAAYAFTILETCGDELVKILNPQFTNQFKAWHRRVLPDVVAMSKLKAVEAKKRFAEPFLASPRRIHRESVLRLAKLKQQRNEFAHRGESDVDFEDYLFMAIGVACQIYFACFPSERKLKLFPFYPYDPKWSDEE